MAYFQHFEAFLSIKQFKKPDYIVVCYAWLI
jgi:hypothetical protein